MFPLNGLCIHFAHDMKHRFKMPFIGFPTVGIRLHLSTELNSAGWVTALLSLTPLLRKGEAAFTEVTKRIF